MDTIARRAILESAGVKFASGLKITEIETVQDKYGFIFPPDLREFLEDALPISKGWVDWRNGDETSIKKRLDWPYDGMCFDIQHDDFWFDDWGERPSSLQECFNIAKQALNSAPKLIPIFWHRYIPDRPCLPGNPVFSVYQTDIIYYGSNLQNYFENEFHHYFKRPDYFIPEPARQIDLWAKLVEENC